MASERPNVIARPMREEWPGERTEERKNSPFFYKNRRGHRTSGVNWSQTCRELDFELEKLGATEAVLELRLARGDYDLRNDGWLRADARLAEPGVVLTFRSPKGSPDGEPVPHLYAVDSFDDWQSNVRAIVIGLNNLRRISRYGLGTHGEQYRGFAALPPAGGSTQTMTAKQAAAVLREYAGDSVEGSFKVDTILADAGVAEAVFRRARRNVHPDAGGTDEQFQTSETAWAILSSHHGVERV